MKKMGKMGKKGKRGQKEEILVEGMTVVEKGKSMTSSRKGEQRDMQHSSTLTRSKIKIKTVKIKKQKT